MVEPIKTDSLYIQMRLADRIESNFSYRSSLCFRIGARHSDRVGKTGIANDGNGRIPNNRLSAHIDRFTIDTIRQMDGYILFDHCWK